MPDNQHDGKLESFLQTLVDANDALFRYAVKTTRRAKRLGAPFSDSSRGKAEIHTWLAWQKEPGLPYGSAIRARYFTHDSPAATAFVAWFRQLFSVV